MRISYPLFGFKTAAIALPAAIIMVVLLASGVTMTNAQQQQQEGQQQLSTSQPTTPPPAAQNGTTPPTALFESTLDSFRVGVPEGWVIHDVNNTGFILAAEVTEGYGLLAQLCPAEEGEEAERQQQQGALTNVSSTSSCQQQQQAQEEVIHILRYPNLGPRLGIAVDDVSAIIPDSILNYQIQRLQGVGYRDINIVNSTDATIDVHYTTAQDVPAPEAIPQATVPARFVEITYSTDSAPSEMRTGYIFLTASNATPPNEMITGYSVFYESAPGRTEVGAEETTQSARLVPLSRAALEILASFELIASEEVAQSIVDVIAQQAAASNEPNDQETAGEEAEDDDE
jgi:hypothetical protein